MGKKRIGTMAAVALSMMMVLSNTVFASESESPENTIMTEISEYVAEQYGSLSIAEQKELEEEIYQEKYVESAIASMNITDETDENVVDIAYQNMIARETYIAELISLHSGVKTTMDDWEYNLNYLKNHYDEVMAMEAVNGVYVDLYIEDYEIVQATRDMPDTQINGIRARASSYSSSDAVSYAEQYYDTYNTAYPDWTSYGGDCANFISQCLYAGGKSMKGTPGTSTAAQNWSNWFSQGSSCNTSYVSSTW